IELNEEDLPRYDAGRVAESFQINAEVGISWRSKSLGEGAFPFYPDQLKTTSVQLLQSQFDEIEMKPGETVRRVRFLAPSQLRWRAPAVAPSPPVNSSARPRQPSGEWSMPIAILIQVACD